MNDLAAEIKKLSAGFHKDVISIRRHMHQHPELSFKEYETAAFIARKLKDLGIPFREKVGGNGLVAMIGEKSGDHKPVAFRADFDALPITEENDVSYKSQNEGVMHACGHDVHTSSLLGAAMILKKMEDRLPGPVKLIFQHAEEKIPGGAQAMIKDGALKNPEPEAIFGQHVMPEMEVGTVGFCAGKYMASADEIFITIKGKGGHAAMPDLNVDPVAISAQLITALQQIISRESPPGTQSVFSIGKVIANGATNVIPDEVVMEGTFRTFEEPWRQKAHERIEAICLNTAKAMRAQCDLEIRKGYPCVENDPATTQHAANAARTYLGKDKVIDLPMRATAEDFAYFTQAMPGCFYRLGTGNKSKGITSSIHTPTFNIDEDALLTGMGLFAFLALNRS